jgi:hypothetical protein
VDLYLTSHCTPGVPRPSLKRWLVECGQVGHTCDKYPSCMMSVTSTAPPLQREMDGIGQWDVKKQGVSTQRGRCPQALLALVPIISVQKYWQATTKGQTVIDGPASAELQSVTVGGRCRLQPPLPVKGRAHTAFWQVPSTPPGRGQRSTGVKQLNARNRPRYPNRRSACNAWRAAVRVRTRPALLTTRSAGNFPRSFSNRATPLAHSSTALGGRSGPLSISLRSAIHRDPTGGGEGRG